MPVFSTDPCPNRSGGLPHTASIGGRCPFCAEEVYTDPTHVVDPLREVDPVKLLPPREDRQSQGLIDDILYLRGLPITPELLGDPARKGEAWASYRAGIDAALDVMVPFLKEIAYAAPLKDHASCYSRPEVDRLIGRVPRRTRRGWS